MFGDGFEAGVELPAYPDGYADDHGRNGDAGEESDANRSADQRAQLPEYLLLPRPGFLAPKGAAGGAEVMQITNLLHAEPAELGAAQSARHVVAGPVVHLGYEDSAPGTRFNVVT